MENITEIKAADLAAGGVSFENALANLTDEEKGALFEQMDSDEEYLPSDIYDKVCDNSNDIGADTILLFIRLPDGHGIHGANQNYTILRKQDVRLDTCPKCGKIKMKGQLCFNCQKNQPPITCPTCGKEHKNVVYDEDTHAHSFVCPVCRRDINTRPYLGYHTRMEDLSRLVPFVGRGSTSNLFFGVELEVYKKPPYENGARERFCADLIKKTGGDFLFCKRDGSLSEDGGVEIVSVPATISEHLDRWAKVFTEKTSNHGLEDYKIPECEGYSRQECGMHIHFSKKGIRAEALMMMIYFFASGNGRDFLRFIADRNFNSYCNPDAIIFDNEMLKKMTDNDLVLQGEHYAALNLGNRNTVELRIFRSNTSRLGFFKNLELAHLLTQAFKEPNLNNAKWQHLINYAYEHASKYKNLIQWLEAVNHSKYNKTEAAKCA